MNKLITALLFALFIRAAVAGSFEDGFAAYERADYATAFRLWKPLAAQGLAGAQLGLGQMHESGLGVPQDYTEAVRWYKLAAAQGSGLAQHFLGQAYNLGRGIPQDNVEAVLWYKLAAAQGLKDAQTILGVCYENGQGIPQDYIRAHLWYNLAAAQGQIIATHNREAIAKKMTLAQIAEAQKLARECLVRKYKNCE